MPSAGIAPGEPYPNPLTRERFSNLQRAALTGAAAIRTVIDVDRDATNDDLNRLITKCYTWGSALIGLESPIPAVPPLEQPARDGAREDDALVAAIRGESVTNLR